MKHAPVYPQRFTSLHAARVFIAEFVEYCNHDHRHAGIGLHASADVRYGLAAATARQRSAALAQARGHHPARFASLQDPKILDLPTTAWINEPTPQGNAA